MKKLFILLCLLLPLLASAQPLTTVKGNAAITNVLIVKTIPCKLYSGSAYNNSGSTVYIQIFQTATNPPNGSVPLYSYPAAANSFLSYDFSYYGLDLDKCTICVSSNALTLVGATNSANIQAIIKQ